VDKLLGTIHKFSQIQRKEVPSGQKTGSMTVLFHRVGELVDSLAECSVDACIIARDLSLGHLQGMTQKNVKSMFFNTLNNMRWFSEKYLFRPSAARGCGYVVCIFWENCLLFAPGRINTAPDAAEHRRGTTLCG